MYGINLANATNVAKTAGFAAVGYAALNGCRSVSLAKMAGFASLMALSQVAHMLSTTKIGVLQKVFAGDSLVHRAVSVLTNTKLSQETGNANKTAFFTGLYGAPAVTAAFVNNAPAFAARIATPLQGTAVATATLSYALIHAARTAVRALQPVPYIGAHISKLG